MPWPLFLVESREAARERWGFVPVGACWPMQRERMAEWEETFSPRYRREHEATRPAYFVKLPDGSEFCIDSRAWNQASGYHGDGWGCSGELPAITLTPSINIVGSYHGWIQNGVITDDCEGRTFPNAMGVPPAVEAPR